MSDDRAITPEQLATLSHEFRTPLNGVLGMARLLDGTRLTAEQKTYVGALRESGDHLLALVNDVLDLARLGAGKIELHTAPTDIAALLRQVTELMSPRAHEKGVEIAWTCAAGLPPVMADEGRLRQVLLNFAGNAVKFTESGGVLLSAEAAGESRLRLAVRDTGPGVPEAARERIFEPFVHADPSHGAVLGGAGLGLAIVTRLGNAMGGGVGVGDAVGGGAEFWLEAAFAPAAAPATERPLAGRTVGLASPNAIVRQSARRQIEERGGKVVVADSVAGLLQTAPADAVLLIDNLLASGRGLKAPAGRPAIILLRPDERARIPRCRAAGFAGYLIKPLRPDSLAARVLAALDAAPRAAPHPEDERIAAATATGARVLLVEDNPINALLASTLLKREGAAVDRAASGREALAACSAASYDLILMDLRMHDLTGVEAARELRARGVTTPIAALTADAFEDDRRACMAAGMNDFLVKPLTETALRAALARWVGWTGDTEEGRLAS
ncbi:MAG: response regulator [Caulobacterales bacterium]|nr:response regulator [Caulobacterales bacterium]